MRLEHASSSGNQDVLFTIPGGVVAEDDAVDHPGFVFKRPPNPGQHGANSTIGGRVGHNAVGSAPPRELGLLVRVVNSRDITELSSDLLVPQVHCLVGIQLDQVTYLVVGGRGSRRASGKAARDFHRSGKFPDQVPERTALDKKPGGEMRA